ncbi:MAG: polysaccharide biosynthesis C-terminal domain-containing protein [Chitinophagales bacterium]
MTNNSSPSFTDLLQKFLAGNKATTLNLLIRGLTLAGKFFLVIFLAKHLTEAQVGEWGIFTTSISLALYLVGLDFYTYSSRTILEFPLAERSRFLRDQFVFYIISYIVLFPLLYLLFVFNIIDQKMVAFFYIILVFEHLAQEAYRTFVVFSKPVWANIILFLRTGSWTYVLLTLWFIGFDDLKTLKTALTFWIAGGALALIATVYMLSKLHFNSTKEVPIDWVWIKRGIRVSLTYFLATICFKIIELSDRYFLDYYHSKEMVGLYTFYANMANMIEIFVHTTSIIIFSPLLIDAFMKNKSLYFETFNKFTRSIVVFTLFSAVLLGIIMYPILVYVINKESYTSHLTSFIVLVAAEMLFNFSLIFHYVLYIRKKDFSVVKATVAAAFTNILLNFIFIPPLGINGAAFATFLSFFMLLIMKIYYARHYK